MSENDYPITKAIKDFADAIAVEAIRRTEMPYCDIVLSKWAKERFLQEAAWMFRPGELDEKLPNEVQFYGVRVRFDEEYE